MAKKSTGSPMEEVVEEANPEPSSSAISPETLNILTQFDASVSALEDALEPHVAVDFEHHLERSALEMAQSDVAAVLVLSTFAWTLSAMRGENPKENLKIMGEIVGFVVCLVLVVVKLVVVYHVVVHLVYLLFPKRAQAAYKRLKVIQNRKNAPRVNATAAKNFVRNALWDVATANERRAMRLQEEQEQVESTTTTTTLEGETASKKRRLE